MAQLLLVDVADLLQGLAHAIQVGDLPAHLGHLIGMQRNLPGLRTRIIHVQDPLMMAFAAGASGAGDARRMKGMPFK